MSRKVYSRTLCRNFLRVKSRNPESFRFLWLMIITTTTMTIMTFINAFLTNIIVKTGSTHIGNVGHGECLCCPRNTFFLGWSPTTNGDSPSSDGQHVDQDDHHHIKDQQLWSIGVVHLCCCSSVGWEHSASEHLRSLFLNTSASVRQDFKKKCYFEMC